MAVRRDHGTILLPIAFALQFPLETVLSLLAVVYMGCEYGGRISSILLNVPGDAGAIMTGMDGHPMAKQGNAGIALSISAVSSFTGALIATLGGMLGGKPVNLVIMNIPLIAAVTFVGVYGVHSGTFDLVLMVVLGVVGYILRKLDFSTAPILLRRRAKKFPDTAVGGEPE